MTIKLMILMTMLITMMLMTILMTMLLLLMLMTMMMPTIQTVMTSTASPSRIWKDMSLNDSMSNYERAQLAVWDYPVSDKYTKMWQSMQEAGLPQSFEEALERVRNSTSSSEGFAFLGGFKTGLPGAPELLIFSSCSSSRSSFQPWHYRMSQEKDIV